MHIVDFEYAHHRLSDFNCIACYIDSGIKSNENDIGCDITFNTVKNNHSSQRSVTSSTYDNVYTTTFDIMKNVCNTNVDDIYFNSVEIRELMFWLSRREYAKFKPLDSVENLNICFYGSFNVKPISFGEDTIGFRLEFTSNAPYGYAESIQSKNMILQEHQTFSLYGDSDEMITLYPKVQIRCFANGKLNIHNQLTDNTVIIDNCVNGETITLEGEYKIIDTDDEEHQKTLYSDFNYSYLDILVDEYKSENIYEVSLPCEIIVSYSPIRKVGVY